MNNSANDVPLFSSPTRTDESFRVLRIDQDYAGCSWHFHPELQLCHVISGSGQRLIGDRVCPIEPGEVVLLGANVPHVWRYDSAGMEPVDAIVVHFDEQLFGAEWLQKKEFQDVRLLLSRAGQGLLARGSLRESVAVQLQQLPETQGLARVISLLEILHKLSESRQLSPICSSGYQPVAARLDVERLRRACDYIAEHAFGCIDRDTVAQVVHMSGSGFSRFFKTHTGLTFQEFVADVRVSKACQLLISTNDGMASIAAACGFGDLTTFNRAFRKLRDCTPSDYRRQAVQIQTPDNAEVSSQS